ncbi:MAG TPA: lysophospholipid acyltransferase family protein [Methylomirabilota bacterium]|nr:lysophospholipid acyltransferase family protein [Methylomirabilota bacterium]
MKAQLIAMLAASVVRLLGRTLRLQVVGAERVRPLWEAGRPVIYAAWHGRVLMMPWASARLRRTHGARRVSVLASRSRDGELVARYAARFGVAAVRGSSSRGGAGGLRALVDAVRNGEDVALVPDGPRGPRGRLKEGVVVLAALTGAPVVPLAIATRPARRLASWDAFLVPLPFARCALVLGQPICVPADAGRERAAKDIAQALDETTAAADRLVAS